MRTKLWIFRRGIEVEEKEVFFRSDAPTYDDIRAVVEPLIDNALLEHVSVLFRDQRADMFVDDMGKTKNLAENPAATAIYRAAALKANPRLRAEEMPRIYGPAVVFERIVWR